MRGTTTTAEYVSSRAPAARQECVFRLLGAARLATLLRGPLPARRRLGAVAVGVRPEDGAVVEEDLGERWGDRGR